MTAEDVLVAGETLIDFVPDESGPLADVESFARRAGGAPANVAVALSRLGRSPLFWTRVGADPFGEFLADRLREEGLSDRFLERDESAQTTLAFVSQEGENSTFTFYRSDTADTRLDRETIDDGALEDVSWLHVGGVALAAEPARSATLEVIERAADRGCTVSFDPNVRPELWANDVELSTICGWAIDSTDVLVATPAELRTLGIHGEAPEALARAATAEGPHTVVLTLGADGAIAVASDEAPWSDGARPDSPDGDAAGDDASAGGRASTDASAGQITRHDGYDVDAVDPTGAGDAFTAGLVDALQRGETLPEALAFANAVGALATTGRGAMSALPAREETDALRS